MYGLLQLVGVILVITWPAWVRFLIEKYVNYTANKEELNNET